MEIIDHGNIHIQKQQLGICGNISVKTAGYIGVPTRHTLKRFCPQPQRQSGLLAFMHNEGEEEVYDFPN